MPYVRISECAPLQRSGAGGRRALHMPPGPGGSGYAMGWFRRFENNRSQLEHNGVFFHLFHRPSAAGFRLWPRAASAVNSFTANLGVYLALKKGLLALLRGQVPPPNGISLRTVDLLSAGAGELLNLFPIYTLWYIEHRK